MFAAGVTMSALTVRSTDSDWNVSFVQEQQLAVHKLLQMDSLAVYWDSSAAALSALGFTELVQWFSEVGTLLLCVLLCIINLWISITFVLSQVGCITLCLVAGTSCAVWSKTISASEFASTYQYLSPEWDVCRWPVGLE